MVVNGVSDNYFADSTWYYCFSASMRQLDNSCHLVRFAIPLRFVESSAGGIHDVMHDGDWGAWLLSSWAKVWRLPLWWRE